MGLFKIRASDISKFSIWPLLLLLQDAQLANAIQTSNADQGAIASPAENSPTKSSPPSSSAGSPLNLSSNATSLKKRRKKTPNKESGVVSNGVRKEKVLLDKNFAYRMSDKCFPISYVSVARQFQTYQKFIKAHTYLLLSCNAKG